MADEKKRCRKNLSTVDAIFVMERAIKFSKPTYLCFVDKTADRVRKNILFNCYEKNKYSTTYY